MSSETRKKWMMLSRIHRHNNAAQEERLQILKTSEAQTAPDAVVSKPPDVQNLQNKRPMYELVLHTPDVQDPQNKRSMSEPAFTHTGCLNSNAKHGTRPGQLLLPRNPAMTAHDSGP